ncbi:hypothetical protein TcWFU_000412 [Taenia crassiceps]|uniref:Uncharacterized protein n=1 Tax=Taenia crassiceps TaxID=6207 RepID=A0ABR4QFM6_9CEST
MEEFFPHLTSPFHPHASSPTPPPTSLPLLPNTAYKIAASTKTCANGGADTKSSLNSVHFSMLSAREHHNPLLGRKIRHNVPTNKASALGLNHRLARLGVTTATRPPIASIGGTRFL